MGLDHDICGIANGLSPSSVQRSTCRPSKGETAGNADWNRNLSDVGLTLLRPMDLDGHTGNSAMVQFNTEILSFEILIPLVSCCM